MTRKSSRHLLPITHFHKFSTPAFTLSVVLKTHVSPSTFTFNNSIPVSQSNPNSESSEMMSYDKDQETFEHTFLIIREVAVYKIHPHPTSSGYKCGEWLQSDKIWSGYLHIVSYDTHCEIRLEDPNLDDLFTAYFVNPGQRKAAIEPVLDSSCYFVLKIENGVESTHL